MEEGIALKEGIKTAVSCAIVSTFAQSFIFGQITGNLKLGTNSESSTGSLCLPNTLNDPIPVTLPIESPLVQIAVVRLASYGNGGRGSEAPKMEVSASGTAGKLLPCRQSYQVPHDEVLISVLECDKVRK